LLRICVSLLNDRIEELTGLPELALAVRDEESRAAKKDQTSLTM
jgi:hypothetical protein